MARVVSDRNDKSAVPPGPIVVQQNGVAYAVTHFDEFEVQADVSCYCQIKSDQAQLKKSVMGLALREAPG